MERLGYPPPALERDHARDRKMVELRAEGRSLAEIGRLFGVSRERVRQLLRRYDGERAGEAAT
jgi:DNA-directed RNA polymerase sigma subunit (sigma70/sigma32)